LDVLAEELDKRLGEVEAEREELVVVERVLLRLAGGNDVAVGLRSTRCRRRQRGLECGKSRGCGARGLLGLRGPGHGAIVPDESSKDFGIYGVHDRFGLCPTSLHPLVYRDRGCLRNLKDVPPDGATPTIPR
jgi:hypothetical protein